MDGFINLLKPPGITSSDAVVFVRKLLPRKTAVGHGGTLDPDAAGVLPICVGSATRLFDYIVDKRKTYVGELCLGAETDTCDASGRVTARDAMSADRRQIERALDAFVGRVMQAPPAYSALKMGGRRLYDMARKGEYIEPEAREVSICAIEYMLQTDERRHLLKIECGKGVYIRSLMRDIARAVGCLGHMSFLLRARAGAFDIQSAHTPEELCDLGARSALMPMDAPLGDYARVDVDTRYIKRVINGAPILPEWQLCASPEAGTIVRLYVDGAFAGMGAADAAGVVAFKAMLYAPDNR